MSACVEPLVFVIGVWPSNLCEFHIAAPDSSNRVRSLDDLSSALVGEAILVSLGRTGIAQYFLLL